MQRTICLLFVAPVVLALLGCGGATTPPAEPPPQTLPPLPSGKAVLGPPRQILKQSTDRDANGGNVITVTRPGTAGAEPIRVLPKD